MSGNRPLPDVYKEITEMHVDISKYRQWMSKEKQLQSQEKVKAHILLYMYFNNCNVMLVVCGS